MHSNPSARTVRISGHSIIVINHRRTIIQSLFNSVRGTLSVIGIFGTVLKNGRISTFMSNRCASCSHSHDSRFDYIWRICVQISVNELRRRLNAGHRSWRCARNCWRCGRRGRSARAADERSYTIHDRSWRTLRIYAQNFCRRKSIDTIIICTRL